MKNRILLTITLLLIVGAGYVHGVQIDRWGQSEKVIAAAERLQKIPTEFGNWKSEASEVDEKQLQQAEAVGHFARRFINQQTGQQVNVMIVCGRPGPISVHPPTVCFIGAGWRLQTEPDVRKLSGQDSRMFWKGRFAKRSDGLPVVIETFWGWNSDGKWLACEQPRLETAGQPFLYKMYITVPRSNQTVVEGDEVVARFLDEFAPRLDRALFEKI